MNRLSLLPAGLIALLLSSSALAAEPTTPADPFYHIAKSAQRPPEPPVCCLRPLLSVEPAEEVLSFEEWKVKQEQALLQQQGQTDGSKARDASASANSQSTSSDTQQKARYEGDSTDGPPPLERPTPSPHFRVPLTDRFNYASLDCSARVHYAHRSARSASSLLSSKKDKYMLSPCNTPGEDKFVVVELCEDIRIDTVQLANFEFFSGVFKDFSVSVAKTYTEGWTPAGTYRAKNIRGIQSFHPPTSLRDFYRFIRIDFYSHYGNEFYCPVSLLRVYGLTHLEQWKWEVWEAEYKEKNKTQAPLRSIASTAAAIAEENARVLKQTMDIEEIVSKGESSTNLDSSHSSTADGTTPPKRTEESVLTDETAASASSEAFASSSSSPNEAPESTEQHDQLSLSDGPQSDSTPASSPSSDTTIPNESITTSSASLSVQNQPSPEFSFSESITRNNSFSITRSSDPSSSHSNQKLNSTSTSLVSSTPIPTIVAHESRSVPHIAATGESIYRTIMTRLSSLEANSTMYLRYVEEQTRSLRDALTRLEEDVGRLEGLSKATTQSFQKIINEMDRQRRRLEREQGELQTRVDYLTDEVILEKRLGIAQLCLLLVVLVFMALTRGSRGEPFMPHMSNGRRDALREWGRRHLSSLGSGEWASKLRNGSPIRVPEDFLKSPIPIKKTETVKFPMQITKEDGDQTPLGSTSNLAAPPPARWRTPAEIRAPHSRQFVSHRPRTPNTSSFGFHSQATRSAGLVGSSTSSQGAVRPRVRRASSHSTPVPVAYSQSMRDAAPVSVKKWAKSAHLHEIRKRSPRRGGDLPRATLKMDQWTAQGGHGSDQENSEGLRQGDDGSKDPEPLLALVAGSANDTRDSSPREPFSTSPLQNRSRRRDGMGLERLYVEPSCQPNGGPTIIDLDTESEIWEDTSADNSEVDEQFT